MGGALVVLAIVVIVLAAVGYRRGWFTRFRTQDSLPLGSSDDELSPGERRWRDLADEGPVDEFRGPGVNTAASADQPMGRRSSVGTVYEQVVALLTAYELGEWLFVDVDERVTGESPLKADEDAVTGYYVRITVDPEAPDGYAIERLTASQYLGMRSGLNDIHVFFASRKTDQVAQGRAKVDVPSPGPDLVRHIPTPASSVERIVRFPMISGIGQSDAMRLAGQLARAKRLTDTADQ